MPMDQIFSSATTSASHIFGNVTKAMEMYIKNMLPDNFLKDSTISSRPVYRHFKYLGRKNKQDKFLHRKAFPCLIMRPIFEVMNPNDDTFLLGTFYTKTMGSVVGSKLGMQQFFKDDERGYGMAFKIQRYRVSFDVTLQVETQYQALDMYNYLLTNLRWEMPDYLPTPLESLIPRDLLMTVAEYVGIDINKQENISSFLKYLRNHSDYPITYMMRNSTSRDEFFLYYLHNILVTFSDLNIDEGEKRNMTDDFYNVTFKATCDFNVMSSYYLYGNNNVYKKIQLCFHIANRDEVVMRTDYTPIYTYDRTIDDVELISRGFRKYSSSIIKTDKKLEGKDDTVNIKCLISPDDYQTYLNHLANENPIDILFRAVVIRNNLSMEADVDWDINWDTLDLTIHNTDPLSTYRVVIYANFNFLNNHKMYDMITKKDQQTIDPDTRIGYKLDP